MRRRLEAHNIIGVGYEGRTVADVIDGLRLEGVTTVIDVRLNPISRKSGLSKTALRERLADADIEYLHLRALGNPKLNRDGFSGTPADLALAVQRYRELLNAEPARDALEEIRRRARADRVALLCFEADQKRCHRHVVLDALDSTAIV